MQKVFILGLILYYTGKVLCEMDKKKKNKKKENIVVSSITLILVITGKVMECASILSVLK